MAAAVFLRHELHHGVQYERGGEALTDLFEDLRDAIRARYPNDADSRYLVPWLPTALISWLLEMPVET